ncbi:MAG: LysR family transcriptional regulator [Roseibium sp.]|uniref:LysR substrate-binding domain-containing protein n=1 Tax=Roseibium sp. TaxID=1936156 RepID=UPI001B06A6B3|nr:LysR substrate-binding domain-containing protein [Roseibium sp.]MBO6893444.1 LysR family transcriptional regulator [Roseibium sp.]MBO6930589.1 LysR family transcriptional regulator [Roseibium sp.]
MKGHLQLRQLEALSALATTGSISRAAELLGISQPAASRLLADLSKHLGLPLYHRKDGRLVLTSEVRHLMPEIRRVLESMDNISQAARNIPMGKAGHLRIACLPGFAVSHLPEVISEFLQGRPDVTVTIEPDRPERILEWIIGEQYDCGITDGFTGHPAIEERKIAIKSACIFPKGHRLEALDEVTPADLAGEKLIHDTIGSIYHRAIAEAFDRAHVKLDTLVETRQFTTACELVSLGTGVSIVSELDARTYQNRGLSYRPFAPDIPHELSLVRPLNQPPSLLTMEFLNQFEDSLLYLRSDLVGTARQMKD